MANGLSKIGKVGKGFDTFQLNSVLLLNDAGDWGSEPDANAVGVIRSTNFNNNGKLDLSNTAYRTLSPTKREEKRLYAADILVERSGGSDTQPVGRVGYITEEIEKSQYAFANFIQRIRIDDTTDPKYVYYCLQQLYEMGITASMQFQTTGIRNLDWKYYLKIILPNPPKAEQTAIANILSKVDEAIAAVQTSIDAAERLQNLLTGKMKPDGTFRTPEEFYTDPKFGKVPLGWEVKKIKDVADNLDNYRKPIKSIDRGNLKGVYPYYGAAGIVDYINDYLFDGIYVLFGEDGENLLSRKLPQAFIVKGKFWVNNHAHILQIHEDYDIELITYILEAKRYDNIVYGSAQPKINKSDLNKIKLIIPKGKDEQKKLSERIANIEKIVLQKQKTKSTLEDLKKSLMQNLLTGKIRIKC